MPLKIKKIKTKEVSMHVINKETSLLYDEAFFIVPYTSSMVGKDYFRREDKGRMAILNGGVVSYLAIRGDKKVNSGHLSLSLCEKDCEISDSDLIGTQIRVYDSMLKLRLKKGDKPFSIVLIDKANVPVRNVDVAIMSAYGQEYLKQQNKLPLILRPDAVLNNLESILRNNSLFNRRNGMEEIRCYIGGNKKLQENLHRLTTQPDITYKILKAPRIPHK